MGGHCGLVVESLSLEVKTRHCLRMKSPGS